jgi:uncharacterized protein (TIGR03437 family)
MLAILDYRGGLERPIVSRTAVGSIERAFMLPMELSGLSMTINGVACGLKSVNRNRIEFVVPRGLASAVEGTTYPLVINNNGLQMKTTVTIVPVRPDIFRVDMLRAPGGRAKVFNVTNSVHTSEPFVVRTIKRKGNKLVPSVLRVYLTGLGSVSGLTIRIGGRDISGTSIVTGAVLVEPGVYRVDFEVPATLDHAGDVPIVALFAFGTNVLSSRLEDTAPRIFIL